MSITYTPTGGSAITLDDARDTANFETVPTTIEDKLQVSQMNSLSVGIIDVFRGDAPSFSCQGIIWPETGPTVTAATKYAALKAVQATNGAFSYHGQALSNVGLVNVSQPKTRTTTLGDVITYTAQWVLLA